MNIVKHIPYAETDLFAESQVDIPQILKIPYNSLFTVT